MMCWVLRCFSSKSSIPCYAMLGLELCKPHVCFDSSFLLGSPIRGARGSRKDGGGRRDLLLPVLLAAALSISPAMGFKFGRVHWFQKQELVPGCTFLLLSEPGVSNSEIPPPTGTPTSLFPQHLGWWPASCSYYLCDTLVSLFCPVFLYMVNNTFC